MNWLYSYADWLIAIGQIWIVCITVGLLNPASIEKPSLFVCVGTTIGMFLITLGVVGQGLTLSIVTSAAVTLQWLLVSVQRYQINHNRRALFSWLWVRWNNAMCLLGN